MYPYNPNREATRNLASLGSNQYYGRGVILFSFPIQNGMRGHGPARATTSRKKQHVDLTMSADVRFKGKTTGLGRLDFINNALPELNFSEIDTSTTFLGHRLRMPFMVSCMTGGYPGALRINRLLAETCEEMQIAMGVGSQRQALEDNSYHKTFSIVRDVAPSIPVVGNIGAAEVVNLDPSTASRLVDLIRADAFAVHLNPLQELLQPEGNPNFRGVLQGIERLVRALQVPVIVKEIGAGISSSVATRLLDAGVKHIDVAGAGGTSWAGVEILRREQQKNAERFWDWGIPLVDCLLDISLLKKQGRRFTLIASGGIASGIDAAKCLALGADIVASARLFLLELKKNGKRGVREMIGNWEAELRRVMFLTGSANVGALQHVSLVNHERP